MPRESNLRSNVQQDKKTKISYDKFLCEHQNKVIQNDQSSNWAIVIYYHNFICLLLINANIVNIYNSCLFQKLLTIFYCVYNFRNKYNKCYPYFSYQHNEFTSFSSVYWSLLKEFVHRFKEGKNFRERYLKAQQWDFFCTIWDPIHGNL